MASQIRFRAGALALSLVFHFLALILAWHLPLMSGGWGAGERGPVVDAPFFLQGDAAQTPPTPPSIPAPMAIPQPKCLLLPSAITSSGSSGALVASAIPRPATTAAANPSFTVPGSPANMAGASMSSVAARMVGGGFGAGGAGLGPAKIELFGVASKGRRFYFLVDVSGSMISYPNSIEGFTRLENEIERALSSLPAGCSFGLLIFSRITERFRENMVPATPDLKRQAMEWFRKRSPTAYLNDPEGARKRFTETRMRLAFSNAIKEHPDVIYLVSDGAPTDIPPSELLDRIDGWQKGRAGGKIVIHSISYSAGNDAFMQELCRKNEGTFLRITPAMMFR